MPSFRGWKTSLTLIVLCMVVAHAAAAQTFSTLASFSGINADGPSGPLVQGTDGSLYGSLLAASPGWGATFRITTGGTISLFHSFVNEPGGELPTGVVVETNGNLYGTTAHGGTIASTCPQPYAGCGTVFGMTAAGTISTLHSFNGLDGINPSEGLTLGPDGSTLYGTTSGSTVKGATGAVYGTIFKITPTGTFTLLHTLSGADGSYPAGPLVIGANGNLYGTTLGGGTYGAGTVFTITPAGTFTTLHNFYPSTDGCEPMGALVLAGDGNFYGTTEQCGNVTGDNNGTVFMISPGGRTFKTLHAFTGGSDGSNPYAGLVLAADGNFYGATTTRGAFGFGALFEITPKGVLTSLHIFDSSDGGRAGTAVTLMQATNGTFYGANLGTVFSLSTGLGPFITTVPTLRGIGTRVLILGQGLTGATSVTFNGVPATFTVNSDTEITTTVPAGATKGYVRVTTPGGTLSTKVVFLVG